MKNRDYTQTEELLTKKAKRLEKDINYAGAVRSAENYERKKRDHGSFFQAPAVQIMSAFLVAAMVGGGTFGALKYLEYKGGQITASQGGGTEISGDKELNADVEHGFGYDDTYSYKEALEEYTKVPYEESDPRGFAAVLTGGEMYLPQTDIVSKTTKTAYDLIETALYDTDFIFWCECKFGGDLVIYNNVEDRLMTVLKVTVSNENELFEFKTPDEAARFLRAVQGEKKYCVRADVTWDDTDLREVGDSYTTYGVAFSVFVKGNTGVKEKSAQFKDVKTLNFSNPVNTRLDLGMQRPYPESVIIKLPIENEYDTVYHIISDEAEELGFDIYLYKAPNMLEGTYITGGVCVLDKDGGLVMNVKPHTMFSQPTYLIYAGDTPSGHPMFFFTEYQELSGPAWTLTHLYACDITTGEITEIAETGPNAYNSGEYFTRANLQYDTDSEEIQYVVHTYKNKYRLEYYGDSNKVITEDIVVFTDRIIWDGEKYALDNLPEQYPDMHGIDPANTTETTEITETTGETTEITETAEETTVPYDPADETSENYDPTGWLIIKAGDKEYKPTLLIKREFKDGKLTETSDQTNDDVLEIEYMAGDEFTARSAIRRGMRVYNVTVNYNYEFDTFEEAFEYLHQVTDNTDWVSVITAVVTWDKDALYEDDIDRCEYLFFARVKYNKARNEEAPIEEWINVECDGKSYHLPPTKKAENGGDKVTYYSTEYPVLRLDYPRHSVLTSDFGELNIRKITVSGLYQYDDFDEAMNRVRMQYGISEIELEITRGGEKDVVYTYKYKIMYDHTPYVPPETAPVPEKEVNAAETAGEFDSWLRSKLFAGMRQEDLRKVIWKIDVGGYTIGAEVNAANYKSVKYEDDVTYVSYGNDLYDLIWFVDNDNVGEKEGGTIREARLILKKGYKNFDLPCGVTLDMTPVEALMQMGFSEEQIEALSGKTTKYGNFTVSYINNALVMSYLINENGYAVDVGIEITPSGSQNEAFIEIERQ